MLRHSHAYDRAKDGVHATARQHDGWITGLGRLGYLAHGVVYALVGLLAALAAIGAGGDVTDARGALNWVIDAPFGRLLLAAIGVGLVGYALWRLVEAALDTEQKGADSSGLLARAGYAISGAVHAGLALTALRLALDANKTESSDQAARDWTARLLAQPWGAWPVALTGAALIGVGLFQIYRALSADFCEKLRLEELSPDQRVAVERVGRLGHAARGVVFGLTGAFLMYAAWQARADEARGLGGVLATLAEQPAGPWLLGVVAVGLLAYGVYGVVEARFRRMHVR